jgi:hypothetical protein
MKLEYSAFYYIQQSLHTNLIKPVFDTTLSPVYDFVARSVWIRTSAFTVTSALSAVSSTVHNKINKNYDS